jgi:tetratricopeptide (TPR) repeat protein
MEKAIEVMKLWKHTYPRDPTSHGRLAVYYYDIGDYEKCIEEARHSVELNPNQVASQVNIIGCLRHLGRLDEAEAEAKKLDSGPLVLYQLAFVRGDQTEMQRQVDRTKGRPIEYRMLGIQAEAAAYSGQLRKAREFGRHAVDLAESFNDKELAAALSLRNARTHALLGDCRQAKDASTKAQSIMHSRVALANAAFALALCGETGRTLSLIDELAGRFPADTAVNFTWLPTIRAMIEMNRNNPAQAIKLLQAASRYELGIDEALIPAYVRGLVYLRQQSGAEAMAEFQKILDRRGLVGVLPHYPLAHLGLARAAALTGDTAKSRKHYEEFFGLWKDADPNVSVLIEARKEYERLK